MHVLYVHNRFPAQFGHLAEKLIEQHGFRCSFVTENVRATSGRIGMIVYQVPGGPSKGTHPTCRSMENFVRKSHAVLEALRQRPDIRPDVIVGHSGYGSTLFLRDFYDCPIVNFCGRRNGVGSLVSRHDVL